MGEHRNDLCQLAQSLVDIATGQVPHFKLTRLPNSAFAACKGRQANVGAQAFGLAREVSAQHQQMLWATTVFVDCRDAPLAARFSQFIAGLPIRRIVYRVIRSGVELPACPIQSTSWRVPS